MSGNFASNTVEVLGATARLHPQFRFACAVALTRSVNAAKSVMPAEVGRVFDRPTMFTTTGFFTQGARKDKLQAAIGVKDKQAQYLTYQVEGGARRPIRQALRLPSVVDLNEYGNLPAGLIRQLVNRAKAGKRATKGQAAKFGVSQKLDLFYGEPGDGRPAGIYKRVQTSGTRHELVPVVVFPKTVAKYERLFDFYGVAHREVTAAFDAALARAWAEAQLTAR